MSRHAILVANRAETSDPRTSVTLRMARENVAGIKRRLASLGQFSFEVKEVIDAKHDQATTVVKSHLDSVASLLEDNDTDCLLFYYFGHAVERNNDLHLIFKDSDTSKLPTLVAFQDIARWVAGFAVRRTLFVLDCCFAGAAMYQTRAAMSPGLQFSVAASTVPTQLAHVREGPSPFGAFSLYFFDGLRDQLAADLPTKLITVDSLFRYTTDKLNDLGFSQVPHLVDGGLNRLVLAEAEPERVLDPRFNISAPKKSFYRKLWWIASEIAERDGLSTDALYQIVKRRRPIEFLTPVIRGEQTVYEPVKSETFRSYVDRMRTLGIIEDDEPLSLAMPGRQMMASDGAKFNEQLIKMVGIQFEKAGTSLESIDSLIRHKLRTRGIPTAHELFLDSRRKEKLSMTTEWFGTVIDLAANCGYFRYSSRKTYFPY